MQVPARHHQVLYVSQLAPGCEYDVFVSICRTARQRNEQAHLSGVLLFDGLRFCQWLHGPAEAVQALMQRIARDPRHVQLQVLYEDCAPVPASPRAWTDGYCDHHEFDVLLGPEALRGEAALAALRSIMARAELRP